MGKFKSYLRLAGLLLTGLLATLLFVLVVLKFTVLSDWTIPQDGMFPTLPAGSRFFALNKPYKVVGDVRRGDVIVFEHFKGPDRYLYIWRVVGLPGDSLDVEDGRVTLGDEALPLAKIRSEGKFDIFREENGSASYEVAFSREGTEDVLKEPSMVVPPDHLFVLGDNRSHASDSRAMGAIPFRSVLARKW